MNILTTPHPFLRHIAKPVLVWNKKIAAEITEMSDILTNARDPEGIGLAATQVGLDRRLFLINNGRSINIYLNPKIVSASPKMLSAKYKNPKKRFSEGCLSVPRLWGFVDRPYSIILEYQLPKTLTITHQNLSDKPAAYIQHELDHLNGILFTDRILEQKGIILKETAAGLEPVSI